jgi:hypothetical protein
MGQDPASALASLDRHVSLGCLQEDLRDLNATVGKAFLALGGALQSISARTREVTALSQSAACLTSTDESDRTIATLQEILADTEHVQDMAETSQREMREILLCLEHSRSPLVALAKLPQSLNAVGLLSRIEAGRLQNAAVDISSLATDIGALKEQVERNVNVIANEAVRLTGLIADGVQQLDKMKGQEQEQAKSLIQNARSVLEALQARAKSSQSATEKIDEQYASIRSASDKIVMSLQSEDMARQRVEHVQEALRQVAHAAGAGEPAEDYLSILALQRSQLLSTRDFLADAIQSISDNLHSLSPRVESLTGETSALAADTDKSGCSLVVAIEEGLGAVASVFGRFSVSARAIVATVENVVPALAGMTKGAKELAEIEALIQLIAINAAIKTTQLGSQAATISVLASELQEVNSRSGIQTRTVLQALQGIDRALNAMSGHGMAQDSRVLRIDAAHEVNAEVSALSANVHTSSRELAVSLSALLEMSRTLRAEIDNACDVANQARATSEAFDSVLKTLDLIFEQLGGVRSAELEIAVKEKMAGLASTYHMASQREVHQKLFGETTNGEAKPEAASETSDLGDNTELF